MTANSGAGNFYKIGFFVFGGILLFLGGVYFSKFLPEKSPVTDTAPSPATNRETQVFISSTAFVPSPTVATKTDEEGIKEAFSQKYNRPEETVTISVSKNNGTHASGGIKFAGEMSGGWFLAFKQNGQWLIADDGNGTISCEAIAPYNFPRDFAPECVDRNGKLIKR